MWSRDRTIKEMKFLISKEALIVNIFLKTAIKLKENNLLKEVLKNKNFLSNDKRGEIKQLR